MLLVLAALPACVALGWHRSALCGVAVIGLAVIGWSWSAHTSERRAADVHRAARLPLPAREEFASSGHSSGW